MDLMEYKAQELFYNYELPASKGITADNVDALKAQLSEVEYPAVVKAQVQVGGRGKAGGIKFAENDAELISAAEAILGMDIKGHTVKKVMTVKKVEHEKELYLSIMLDRTSKCPVIMFSVKGGMDIEQVAHENPEDIIKTNINPFDGVRDYHARYLANAAGFTKEQEKELFALLKKLYKMFTSHDCTLVEINPLAVKADGSLILLDGKVSIDDSAIKRLPDIAEFAAEFEKEALVAEAEKFNFLYIPCDMSGDIAVMSNGSGMIMSCIDIIAKNGMTARAGLDLGGGSTSDRIKEAVRIMCSDPAVSMLFINIFGGITRCDEVAGGIRKAVEEYGVSIPMVVRFEGTNKEAGLEIIKPLTGVTYADGLVPGVMALKAIKDKEAGK